MSTTNGNGKSKRSKTAVQELENLPTVEEMLGQTPPATSEETTPETLVTNEQPTQPEKAPVDGAGRKGEEAGEQGVGRRGEKELMNNSSLPSPQLPSATGTPSSSSPPPPAQSSSASSSPTAEELLRQAKAQTKEKPQEEQPQQAEETTAEAGALAETGTDVATGAIAQQQEINAGQKAEKERIKNLIAYGSQPIAVIGGSASTATVDVPVMPTSPDNSNRGGAGILNNLRNFFNGQ